MGNPKENRQRLRESLSKRIGRPTDVEIVENFKKLGIERYAQVGCSITDTISDLWAKKAEQGKIDLVTVANEHSLPAIAAGNWFGTGELTLMHMQNSGLPNAGDGLISLLPVYGIPAVALVTWRGSNETDASEPHQEIGKRTEGITKSFVDKSNLYGTRIGRGILHKIEQAVNTAKQGKIAMIRLSPDAFEKTHKLSLPNRGEIFSQTEYNRQLNKMQELAETKGSLSSPIPIGEELSRDKALMAIVENHPNAAILFANGFTARAGQAVTDRFGNFYNVGNMGGTLAIGWALARSNPNIEVVVIDGDQNAQMGTMKDNLKAEYPENLHWYILNNGIGASVGTVKSPKLALDYYQLARVLETTPDEPGSFKHTRVGAQGVYFESKQAKKMAKERGTLPAHAQMFKRWIQEQTATNLKNKKKISRLHPLLARV